MQPTLAQVELLQAIASGLTLKSHRDLEGNKEYRLHTSAGQSVIVAWKVVEGLQSAGLIDSNKKFPSATYWLTDTGRARLESA
jgi:predicted transcriptional regulator